MVEAATIASMDVSSIRLKIFIGPRPQTVDAMPATDVAYIVAGSGCGDYLSPLPRAMADRPDVFRFAFISSSVPVDWHSRHP